VDRKSFATGSSPSPTGQKGDDRAMVNDPANGYAEVNGLRMYY
jgi:hypothetical protein